MFSIKEDGIIPAIDKTANNVAFICNHLYALTITKELNLDCHLSNQDDNNTYTFRNNKTEKKIIKEHKLYLSKYKIDLTNNMQDLPVIYRIPKIRKSPVSFPFIIGSPVCRIFKQLSKDITSIFKSVIVNQALWTIQNSYLVISSINQISKCISAKSMSTFLTNY